MRDSIAGFIVGFGAFVVPCGLSAEAPAAAPAATDECAKELLLSYFPEPIVIETLKRFNVAQDKWAGINKSLSSKDKEVVKIVEEKAAAMHPNPLKDPQQRQAAVKLFRETLLQVFSDAMKDNGMQDASQFQAMLDDIQQQKAKKFAMCMEKQKAHMQQHSDDKTGAASGDEDSDDDSDESDDDADADDSDDSDKADDTVKTDADKENTDR